MKAIDILDHLKGLREDLPEKTVDRIIYGDPEQEAKKVATCWMPYIEIIEEAREMGVNVIVAHEPTFFSGQDLDDTEVADLEAVAEKKKLLDEAGITIVRCHDSWDYYPDIGIMASWAKFLGLTDKGEEQYVYNVPQQTALEFARSTAARTADIGQSVVRLYGDPQRNISSVQAWFGWKSPYEMFDSGADLVITYDDNAAIQAWRGAELCHDTGNPLLVVNHGVLEEAGMASLAQYLSETFPDLEVIHLKQGCTYLEVDAEGPELT